MIQKKIPAGFAFVTVLLVLIGLSISCGGSSEPAKKGKIGEKISTEKFDIVVSSVNTRNSVGSEFFKEKASQGAVFVVVNFNYKNISKEPIGSFNTPTIKIVDPNNVSYDSATGASAAYATEINLDKKIASDLNPGITQKDAVVFEVSKESWDKAGWKLIIKADNDVEITIK
jgi:hypothetical protein